MKNYTLLDGGVGTSLWEKSEDKSPVWKFNYTNPDIVQQLAVEMADAGAEIVLANTFSANPMNISREKFDHSSAETVTRAVALAKEALGNRVKVALGVGPLTALLEPYGDLEEDECAENFREMMTAGVKSGVDVIYCQTFIDLAMLEIAVKEASHFDVPVFCSMSFGPYNPNVGGRTMFGNTPADICQTLSKYNPVAIGLNCSSAPEDNLPIIKEFSEVTDMPLIYKPNTGTPTQSGGSAIDYETFANSVSKAAEFKNVKYLGGCCGANAKYIAALKRSLDSK